MYASAASRAPWRRLRAQGADPDLLLHHFGLVTPPIDVVALAIRMGIRLFHNTGSRWCGQVDSTDPEDAKIFVRREDTEQRQRFTIAHEIGHLMLHPLGQRFRDGPGDPAGRLDPQEVEANRFAADLLMPAWMLGPLTRGRSTRQLAGMFNVSEEAMRYRLRNLYGR